MKKILGVLALAALLSGCAAMVAPQEYVRADLMFYQSLCDGIDAWLEAKDVEDEAVRAEIQAARVLAWKAWLLHLETAAEANEAALPACPATVTP